MRIKGFEDYTITKSGRIFSNKFGRRRELKVSKHDYTARIILSTPETGPLSFSVSRLVLDTFNPLPEGKDTSDYTVRYIDGNPLNCHIDNLYRDRKNDDCFKLAEDLKIPKDSDRYAITEVVGFTGYLVDVNGEVYSTRKMHRPPFKMRSFFDKGIVRVSLQKDNVKATTTRAIAKLVLEAFDPIDEGESARDYKITHINNNRLDNRLDNLDWCHKKYR